MYEEILLFGDSITQQGYASGWVSLLSNAYVRQLRVVNYGLSGYNTTQALHVLPQIVPSPERCRVRLLTVFFGANDARIANDDASPQHVPLPLFKENLKKITTHPAIQAHRPRIVLLTPPPVCEGVFEDFIQSDKPHRTPKQTAMYVDAIRQVGEELDLPVLDIWTAFLKKTNWDGIEPLPGSKGVEDRVLPTLLSDGLHLSPAGNQIVYEELMNLIAQTWPELTPERLSTPLPVWDDVNHWQNVK